MSSNYISRLLDTQSLGVSDDGKMKVLVNDIKALMSYVDVMIGNGPWKALNNSKLPIGSATFIPTNTKCSDVDSTNSLDRYIYHNSIPTGDNKSLMAGITYDIETLGTEASNLLNVFSDKSGNKCKKIKANCVEADGSLPKDKDIIKDENGNGYLERAINIDEIKDIDPCMFYPENNKRVNPITGKTCKEGMVYSIFENKIKKNSLYKITIFIIILSILLL